MPRTPRWKQNLRLAILFFIIGLLGSIATLLSFLVPVK